MVVGGKRKRQAAAAARSEVDKFAHKSGVLLQREAKKVRAFQVRKAVQQLKQTRAQLEQRRSAADSGKSGGDGGAKLSATVQRLEREHEALKALDLRAVVQRAMLKTGLQKRQQQRSVEGDASGSDDDEMRGGADGSDNDDDDGFDSDEYENARRTDAQRSEDDDSEDESDDEEADSDAEEEAQTQEAPSTAATPTAPTPSEEEEKAAEAADRKKKSAAAEQLQTTLVDRILAHKQMKPLLEAIEKWLEIEERESEKKLRRQEKKALKRDRNEVLIGGRSATAPASLFLGSLSGRADERDDGGYGVTSSSYMTGADDDIAEFLGEKKKKNRAGQNARRQKAMRVEEATRRKQDRENGVFRPHLARRDDGVSKYGPSERPKKKPAPEAQRGKRGGDKDGGRSKRPGGGREHERGAPRAAASSAAAGRGPAAKVEVAHPSWIAKQALKEKEKASAGVFSGKKITFE